MKKTLLSIVVLLSAMAISACTDTFLVSKDGKGYFVGSKSKNLHRMLCDTGDLKKILADTALPGAMSADLYKYNCTVEKSGKKVREMYVAMSPVQRKELRTAFRRNGYDINYMPC